jgi:mono/diheme cytochrome c family protein
MPTSLTFGRTLMHRMFWLLLSGFFCPGCQEPAPTYPKQTPPAGYNSASAIQLGRELFDGHCASCHGDTSEGRSPRADFFLPPAPDFKSAAYARRDPSYLYWRIATGKTVEPYLSSGSVMPAWRPYFSDRQIWTLVAYLQSRSR